MYSISIIPFEDAFAADFSRLNKAWLEKYFEVEPVDEEMLANPRKYYIDKGGFIFLAALSAQNQVVGSYALIRTSPDVFELSKMAVDERCQGQKIGGLLLDHAIETARSAGAAIITLYSHSKLQSAIHLYRKAGFREIPVGDSIYKRSDIKMEKIL